MKIVKLLLLSLTVIFLSCSEEEDPLPTSQGMIGTWTITALEYKGSTTTSFEGGSLKADFTGSGKDMTLTTTFSESPNTVVSAGSYTIVLKTTMMGQTSTDEVTMYEVLTDGTWALNGRDLTVTNDGFSQKATIVEQNSTNLKIKFDTTQSQSDQGITVTTNVQGVYTFKKN